MTTARRSLGSRALIGLTLFLVLGGPTPGAVGDCSSTNEVANAAQFCADRETYICARALANNCSVNMIAPYCDDGSITMPEAMQCVSDGVARCTGANWPTGCAPTQNEADACIAALSNRDRLSEPDPPAGFSECDLCPAE